MRDSLVDERLRIALMVEDDLGRVVRAHLFIERRVNSLLDLAVEHPKLFDGVLHEFIRAYVPLHQSFATPDEPFPTIRRGNAGP